MPTSESPRDRPLLVTAPGPRACEAALLDLVEQSLRRLGTEILHQPIWIIVPSVSLRAHLLASIARHFDRSVSGLACWTLRGLATDIVARSGPTPPPAGELLPLLIHRLAAAEPPLQRSLDHLAEGYSAVVRSVRDLLDAGLAEGHRDALEEVLAAEGRALAGRAAVERAQSLIRVGCSLLDELGRLGVHHDAQILEIAAERVRFHNGLGVEPGELLVYGFSDATGLATDLIAALLERSYGRLILDLPPAADESLGGDGGSDFIRRFRERIESITRPAPVERPQATTPRLDLIRSYGADAECREVATRIRNLISEGAVAERIGVVARQLEPYSTPLRRHFFRLGVPFSGIGVPGPQLPLGRQIGGFAELLRLGAECRVDRWLELRIDGVEPSPDFDLRLALFGLGASTIAEVAQLDLSPWSDKSSYPLPARYGLEADAETDRERVVRRTIPMEALHRVRAQATDLTTALRDRGEAAPWRRQVERLRQLGQLLGWEVDTPIAAILDEVWSRLELELPAELSLSMAETERMMVAALRDKGRADFGGQGSGVQVLDVVAARSRTFDHLFLVGLNQGVFPRTIRDDPLLDDGLRRVMAREGHGVLPDLGRKRLGHAEERYLFSQLLRSSSKVTISWQYTDDDGKPQIASPLLRRLQLETRLKEKAASSSALTARHPFALRRPEGETHATEEVFTPYEQAVRTALRAARSEWSPSLRLALADARASNPSARELGFLADARLSILNEYDQKPFEVVPPGPYFGFSGPPVESAESQSRPDLYITTLEAMARCPWQTFLQRMLRLEVHPDPTEQLPTIDARALGQMVHRSLESIVGRRLQERSAAYASVHQIEPSTFAWPDRPEVDRILWGQARRLVRELGLSWDGLTEILVSLARPFVDQAATALERSAEWSIPVAVEAEGELTIDGSTVRFRADRVDRRGQAIVGVDYKTGARPISTAKQEKTRRRHWLDAVRSGTLLQAMAYGLATGRPNDGGEYLYLHPDLGSSPAERIFAVEANDEESKQSFLAATEALLTAWSRGLFFPRLVDPEPDREPEACKRCDVSEACLRGDSGARIRLRRYLLGASPSSSPFHRAWYLTDDAGAQRGRS